MYMQFPNGALKAMTLSYDDGVIFDKKLIEILRAHGLKGTFNLNSGRISDGERKFDRILTLSEMKELYLPNGMEIGMHGIRHATITETSPAEASLELVGDKANLEKFFGVTVNGGAYANGAFDDRSVEILKNADVRYFRTTVSTHGFDLPRDPLRLAATCHHADPNLGDLADEFCAIDKDKIAWWRRHPKLFYLWGHSYEFNDNDNWDIIERFAEKVGGKSDIWYATNLEIFDYIDAYRRMRVSCDGKILTNLSAQTLWFGIEDKDYVLAAGETLFVD